jgi:antitoxin MazE
MNMEAAMQVNRWGNSLAVRLPKWLVDQLGLSAGDALTIVSVDEGRVTLARDTARSDALARMRTRRIRLPDDYRFDREAAHERGPDRPEKELRR